MAIYMGSSTPSAYYLGSTAVSAIYMGSTLVWSAASPYPVLRNRSSGASASTDLTSHSLTNPTGATIGDLVVFVVGIDFTSGNSVSVSVGTGWAINTTVAASNGHAMVTAWKVLTGSGDALTLATSTGEQSSFLGWAYSTYTGTPMISTVTVGSSGGAYPDSASVSFGSTKACTVITAGVQSQGATIQSGAPTGYSQFNNINSNTNSSASVRTFKAERDVMATSEDPPAWPVSVADPITVTIAIQG